jgi:hypothetical protein
MLALSTRHTNEDYVDCSFWLLKPCITLIILIFLSIMLLVLALAVIILPSIILEVPTISCRVI